MLEYSDWLKEQKEYEDKTKKVIEQIDSSLEFIEIFYPSSTLVCKVKRNDSAFIFKVANYEKSISELTGEDDTERHFQWKVNQLRKEKNALIIATGISRITHLVQSYENLNEKYVCPILKEFFYGESLFELKEKISNITIQQKLENTIRDIHRLGLVNLDIRPTNVFLSYDKKDVCLIEIGAPELKKEVGNSKFKELKLEDLERLEKYIFE
jgi:serine/threonine protein kinase